MANLHTQVQRTERLTNETADVLHSHKFWLTDLIGSFAALFYW